MSFAAQNAHAKNLESSPNLMGALGLNTAPNARMDKSGTIRGGVGTSDPYVHSWLGLQIADPLSVTLRQSAEISNLNEDADRLYPGVDLKIRLLEESKTRPQIALGLQSAIGHKRMAGEYLALSKRCQDFDFTAGLGWGRFGTAGHFKNPLKGFSSHFGKNRLLDGELPNEPSNWFTGEDVGIFAGVEYHTPWDGLSLKLDYGADRYTAESSAFNFETPSPWAVGLNYRTPEWHNLTGDLGIGIQGTDKIMARLSLQSHFKHWRKEDAKASSTKPMRPYRTGLALPAQMQLSAEKDHQFLYGTHTQDFTAHSKVMMKQGLSTPRQIGWAAKHMANHAGPIIEELQITPTHLGLKGPTVRLMRTQLEQANAKDQGSAEEIWHKAQIIPQTQRSFKKLKRPAQYAYGGGQWKASLDNQFSLSEEDSGTLYRSSFQIGGHGPSFFGLIDSHASLRINIKDNLEKISKFRPRSLLPVRSNEDRFAARTIGMDTQFLSYTHSLNTNTHVSLMGGYVEEMYAGFGGELLYRPYNARWAIGAESFIAMKRDPETQLNLGLNGDSLLTGHIQGWYDIPKWDVTAHASIGRYLAEDIGASLGLQKTFRNGAKLEGFVTLSDTADFDLFGGTTHSYHGIKIHFPLGGFSKHLHNTDVNVTAAPFGRDIGQRPKNPLPLYELTDAFNMRHISKYWDEITE